LWNYFSAPDPTGGLVNYLSGPEAHKKGLAYVRQDGKAVLKVDSSSDLPLGAPRDSWVVPAKFVGGRRASNSTNYFLS
jgi:hypothetical protein